MLALPIKRLPLPPIRHASRPFQNLSAAHPACISIPPHLHLHTPRNPTTHLHHSTAKMTFTTTAQFKHFGGDLYKLKHASKSTNTDMAVNLYLPPQAREHSVPVLFFLSGLTCGPDNCTEKGGFQKYAAERGLAIVWPDTSPRGANIPGEDDSWDFGTGAGFYLTATKEPYAKHYDMYTYLTTELPNLLSSSYPQLNFSRVGITGHSMGGHGALVLALKNPGKYRSVSAFSPIAHPSHPECAWGQKAFKGYLGEDTEAWKEWDATELVGRAGWEFEAKVDVGTGDQFLKQGQLRIDELEAKGKEVGANLEIGWREGYDHSYYFISTFAEEHVKWHADRLLQG